ncbi:aminotransferase class III-fold pyridoxal phosphate-dependent enzyme [Actinomadura terrae]|uniref:aminotransferase class III-fold pyridoxal phosphate-dependent enzyme n=1 Tax=Actinomadura terrae TaxID=604353 RepID=UPI001FA6ED0F|nr:aminotransferase class III-fold pyridoxal phosphate-dependent enzyme [Actinomadura terrae]
MELLADGARLHMDHYAGAKMPFACLGAAGLHQEFMELDGENAGRVFSVLDASGGYGSACLGAGSRTAFDALASASRLGHVTDEVVSEERSRLLVDVLGEGGLWSNAFPPGEYHVSGRNSGSEGMELALRLVLESRFDRRRLRHRPGGESRDTILAFEGAWHGWTSGLVPALNRRHYRVGLPSPAPDGPFGIRFEHIPFGEPEILRDYMEGIGDRLLAVFVEPIQGDAGILEPPEGYLRELAALAASRGALLVADEVLTFARTGSFFAMRDGAGPVPTDITVIGKSLGMGLLSTSLVIARRSLGVRASGAVATSDLRPLTCAVIRKGLRHIVEENLLERSVTTGERLRVLLEKEVVEPFPDIYSEVRGSGLMQGVELTEPAAARLPALRESLVRSGVYVEFMAGAGRRSHRLPYIYPTMRVAPPLITDEDHVERIARCIREGTWAFQKLIQAG